MLCWQCHALLANTLLAMNMIGSWKNMVKFASKLQKKKCYKGSKTIDASAMPERGLADYPLIQVCKHGTCHIVTRRLVSKVSKTSTFSLLVSICWRQQPSKMGATANSEPAHHPCYARREKLKSKHLTTYANVHMLLWNAMCMVIAANNTGGVYILASISLSLPEHLILPQIAQPAAQYFGTLQRNNGWRPTDSALPEARVTGQRGCLTHLSCWRSFSRRAQGEPRKPRFFHIQDLKQTGFWGLGFNEISANDQNAYICFTLFLSKVQRFFRE